MCKCGGVNCHLSLYKRWCLMFSERPIITKITSSAVWIFNEIAWSEHILESGRGVDAGNINYFLQIDTHLSIHQWSIHILYTLPSRFIHDKIPSIHSSSCVKEFNTDQHFFMCGTKKGRATQEGARSGGAATKKTTVYHRPSIGPVWWSPQISSSSSFRYIE